MPSIVPTVAGTAPTVVAVVVTSSLEHAVTTSRPTLRNAVRTGAARRSVRSEPGRADSCLPGVTSRSVFPVEPDGTGIRWVSGHAEVVTPAGAGVRSLTGFDQCAPL